MGISGWIIDAGMLWKFHQFVIIVLIWQKKQVRQYQPCYLSCSPGQKVAMFSFRSSYQTPFKEIGRKNDWLKTIVLWLFRWFSSTATKSAVWEWTTSVPSHPDPRRTCTQASVCLPILLSTGMSSQQPFAVLPAGGVFSSETSESRIREWNQRSRQLRNGELPIKYLWQHNEAGGKNSDRLNRLKLRDYGVKILLYWRKTRNCNTCCWMLQQLVSQGWK